MSETADATGGDGATGERGQAPLLTAEGHPRRIRTDLYSPAETAIRQAVIAVEEAGADVRLTEAVMLLTKAKEKVADFVDDQIRAAALRRPAGAGDAPDA